MIGYESIQMYYPGCPSGASHSHNIIYNSTPLPIGPLRKGNSQMESSVQEPGSSFTVSVYINPTLAFIGWWRPDSL